MLFIDFVIMYNIKVFGGGGEKDVIFFCMFVIYMFIFIQKKDFGIKLKYFIVILN